MRDIVSIKKDFDIKISIIDKDTPPDVIVEAISRYWRGESDHYAIYLNEDRDKGENTRMAEYIPFIAESTDEFYSLFSDIMAVHKNVSVPVEEFETDNESQDEVVEASEKPLSEKILTILGEMLSCDPIATLNLVKWRVPCNEEMVKSDNIVVYYNEEHNTHVLSPLSVISSLVYKDESRVFQLVSEDNEYWFEIKDV